MNDITRCLYGFDRKPLLKTIEQGIEVQREYRNKRKEVVDHAKLGDELEVHIKVRSLEQRPIDNATMIDLLPGGFDVVPDSVRITEKDESAHDKNPGCRMLSVDYVDVREDRVVIYGTIEEAVAEFVYRIKAVNKGRYIVPPVQAESMYNRRLQGCGLGGQMVVEE